MPADAARVIENLRELQALTGDADGAQRVAWTPTWLRARAWFQAKLDELPFRDRIEHHLDAAGNAWYTLRGESRAGAGAGQPSGFGAERRLAGWLSGRAGGA